MENNERLTRAVGGGKRMRHSRSRHEFCRNSFSQRVINGWNGLPENVKNERNPDHFKRLYRRLKHQLAEP